ncbi:MULTISPECIES: Stealth CR1 domain-containing protein [unclassified Prevotella]|uniref:Stealth CR1 domain-containing protein n=1 Tax=unclassified Prevotella TaxID=2638335 RepID=UPI00051C5318|nr:MULTISPECIES: Stealth CR1 domain-containing protein [unclassified Prevotella]
MEHKIDFVVLWLDSNDPAWQQSYAKYKTGTKGHIEWARFRDTNVFNYWFRAVETYAPWVNKVYLVTNGKFPTWINANNPKLVLVKHSDYIPEEYLPTFNAYTIELFIHRIKGLSEHFVFFNDDMMLNAPVEQDYFFKKGLPCDRNKETYLNVPIYTKEDKFGINITMLTDIGILNSNFNRWQVVKQSPKRWFGPHLGLKGLITSALLSKQRLFTGFSNYHLEQAYLKSSIEEVWEKNTDFLFASCTRFREDVSANQYLFRYWQFATNRFYPTKRDGLYFMVKKNSLKAIEQALLGCKSKSICLNDTPLCTEDDYEWVSQELKRIFDQKFPQKSSFEL